MQHLESNESLKMFYNLKNSQMLVMGIEFWKFSLFFWKWEIEMWFAHGSTMMTEFWKFWNFEMRDWNWIWIKLMSQFVSFSVAQICSCAFVSTDVDLVSSLSSPFVTRVLSKNVRSRYWRHSSFVWNTGWGGVVVVGCVAVCCNCMIAFMSAISISANCL